MEICLAVGILSRLMLLSQTLDSWKCTDRHVDVSTVGKVD